MDKIYILWKHDHNKKHTEILGAFIGQENAEGEKAILQRRDPHGEYGVEEVCIIDA